MGFTNKVANIIKTQVANTLVNNLQKAISGVGQPKKLAARLANKSPLDLSKSPTAHMEPINSPFTFGSTYYPQETSNLGDGHYIIFDVIENNKTNYGGNASDPGAMANNKSYPKSLGKVGESKLNQETRLAQLRKIGFANADDKIIRTQSSGLAVQKPTHTRLAHSIVLYTPTTGTKFDYKVGYENVDTGIAGMLGGLLDGKDLISKLGDAGGAFVETVARSAIEIAVPGFGAALDKGLGRAINPKAELVFKNVPFRTFTFPFEFIPKNLKEKEDVHKIINIFKFHMLPEKLNEAKLTAPGEFQITYMYRDNANMYIPKISRCVLTDFSVDYSPEGVFTTFKADDRGAPPVSIKVEMSFTEMEIMTKETIATGH